MTEDILVIARLLESESAVSGNDEKCVRQAVLDAHLVYQCVELTVDAPAGNDATRFGIGVCLDLIHFS